MMQKLRVNSIDMEVATMRARSCAVNRGARVIVFDCRTDNDPAMMSSTISAHVFTRLHRALCHRLYISRRSVNIAGDTLSILPKWRGSLSSVLTAGRRPPCRRLSCHRRHRRYLRRLPSSIRHQSKRVLKGRRVLREVDAHFRALAWSAWLWPSSLSRLLLVFLSLESLAFGF